MVNFNPRTFYYLNPTSKSGNKQVQDNKTTAEKKYDQDLEKMKKNEYDIAKSLPPESSGQPLTKSKWTG